MELKYFEVIYVKIKVGDIVARKSYGLDIIFTVDRIISRSNGTKFAIIKGLVKRIEASADLEDLELVDINRLNEEIEIVSNKLEKKTKEYRNSLQNNKKIYTGKILHLDGDRKYSEKSYNLYNKLGLNAIVKNIPERAQSQVVIGLLNRYNPDILVVTGHDAILKNDSGYHNIYNYRNSRHFIDTVKEARKWGETSEKLAIFARSMPELFRSNNGSWQRFCIFTGKGTNRFC